MLLFAIPFWGGYYQPGDYFVHIDPIADHKEGDVFQITGCTNVPKETIFEGGLVQTEYFTPGRDCAVPSTVKNISIMPGCNESIQYFSYEVNSTDFEYSRYDVLMCSIVNPHEHTHVIDSRSFNLTLSNQGAPQQETAL